MSEIPTNPSHDQQLAPQQAVLEHQLHGQQLQIDLRNGPLISKDEALKSYALNGDIMAIVQLPGKELDKQVAIMDYGEPDPDKPKPTFVFEGQPMPIMGVAKERYGLRALNYGPEGHLSTHVGFSEGKPIEIGRSDLPSRGNNDASYRLGLTAQKEDNELISRSHATISIENGILTIADHSTNGTVVQAPDPEQFRDTMSRAELHQRLGEDVLQAAALERPQDSATRQAVQEGYRSLGDLADKLASGTFDPSVMVGNMRRVLQKMPESEQASLGELQAIIEGMVDNYGRPVDRYGIGMTASQVARMARSRLR